MQFEWIWLLADSISKSGHHRHFGWANNWFLLNHLTKQKLSLIIIDYLWSLKDYFFHHFLVSMDGDNGSVQFNTWTNNSLICVSFAIFHFLFEQPDRLFLNNQINVNSTENHFFLYACDRWTKMGSTNEENILYGGPEPPLVDDESQSLGEVLLKKLTINPNDVMFVSIE